MISYLSGKIILKKDGFVILDVNGVGYEVFVSAPSFDKLPEKGEPFNVFCYLDVGERSLKLFGFLSYKELELFKIVRGISGVGPKAALEISSIGSLEKIKEKMDKNADVFEGISGIGKMKAQKIVLELTGKFKALKPVKKTKQEDKQDNLEQDDVFIALINLGFQKDAIKQALLQIPSNIEATQEKITHALQLLGK